MSHIGPQTDISLLDMPEELLPLMLGQLPAYSFAGERKVNSVCKLFDKTAHTLPEKTKKTSAQAVMKSTQTNLDALNILKDRDLCGLLSTDDILELVNQIPAVAEHLFNNTGVNIKFKLANANSQLAQRLVAEAGPYKEDIAYSLGINYNRIAFNYSYKGRVRLDRMAVDKGQLVDLVQESVHQVDTPVEQPFITNTMFDGLR